MSAPSSNAVRRLRRYREAAGAASLAAAALLAGCSGAPTRPPKPSSAASAAAPAAAATAQATAPAVQVPAEIAAAYEAAVASLKAGNFAAAEAGFAPIMRAYPMLPGPYVNAAIAYVHDGRDDDALAALHKALAIEPDDAQANDELGVVLRRRGDFAGAEKAYRRALAARPGYPLALYNLGVLLDVYLRRPAEALPLYEQYQQSLAAPDKTVAGWIVDLKRRVGAQPAARVAQEKPE